MAVFTKKTKTVADVVATFKQAVTDLRAISAASEAEIAETQTKIKELEAKQTVAENTGKEATKIANNIEALISVEVPAAE